MSRQDRLGPLMRALVAADPRYLGVVEDIVKRLKEGTPEAHVWHGQCKKMVQAGLPKSEAPPAKPRSEPTIIELGEFEVNYDETIASKIAGNADPKRIGWHNRKWATDEKFSDSRKGKKRFKAIAVCFRKNMPQEGEGSIEAWCKENKKILATPKEGIDLAIVSPRPKLDDVMPLAMAGQFFLDANRRHYALYFYLDGDERYLEGVWLGLGVQWDGLWWFLVLEELPSEV